MGQMETCISKANSGKSSSDNHLAAGFSICWVFNYPNDVFACYFNSLCCPDITYGVRSLISRP